MAQMAARSLVKIDGGYFTLDNELHHPSVQHKLGVIPNFGAIWVDTENYDIIPYGSCVCCTYQLYNYQTQEAVSFTNEFRYLYNYKHITSGNLLGGNSSIVSNYWPTETLFYFVRGNNDFSKFDTNGNLLKYRWVVGYLPTSE